MRSSITVTMRFWIISVTVTVGVCLTAGYFFTTYQQQHLRGVISNNTQLLARPVQPLIAATKKPLTSPPVDELISDIAQRYPITLHFERTDNLEQSWLVTIEAASKSALTFVTEVIGSQFRQYSHYPVTQSLHWRPIEQRQGDVYGQLKWHFLWQSADTISDLESPLYATHFAPIDVPTLACHDKPFVGLQPVLTLTNFADAVLTAIQTTPVRKAVFMDSHYKWATASEGDWLSHSIKLESINSNGLTLSHWQQSGDCWHRYSQQLRIHKESDAS